jgi:uncharacterized glyoxalase superfamily protein PhnB
VSLRSLKPFIPSGASFETARSFFEDLGFSVNWESDGYAELQSGGAVFVLQDYENREVQDNLMMLVAVEDLDGWWRKILASGVLERYPGVRAKPPEVYPWGLREVHLVDPAGVCWHFVETRTGVREGG